MTQDHGVLADLPKGMSGTAQPHRTAIPRDRAEILGCRIDRLDMAGTVARAKEMIESGRGGQQVSINAAKMVALHDDPRMREFIARSALVNADGQAVVWASRILGDPLPERVAGVDLFHELLALAEREDYGVYLLGAKPEVLETAVARIGERYPELRVVGHHHGYFSDAEIPAVVDDIRAAAPQMLFVAMSSPKKEYFLDEHGPALGIPYLQGVGGSIDIVAGLVRRAPGPLQRLGLEWLFRLLQEPRRMVRRYVTTNARFIALVVRELATRRRS